MSNFQVGVAVRDITPADDWIQEQRIWLWGYGNRFEACEGVYQKIATQALVIKDEDGNFFVLVAVDIGALDPEMTKSVRNRIGPSRDLEPEYICLNVSHTHGAPVTALIPTWQPGVDVPDNEYRQFLEQQIVDAIEEAFQNLQPAMIAFGRGTTDIGVDRHFGSPGFYDPTLDVIKVSNDGGETVAVAFFAACHPVCLGNTNLVYSDFPGVARDKIEAAVGGVAMFLQGYGGICNPNDDVNATGSALAQDVLTILNGPMDELDGPLDAWLSTIELPFQPLPSSAVINQAKISGDVFARWANYITSLGNAVPETLSTQLQALRLGIYPNDWYLVASSHEVTTDFGELIRNIWPYPRVTTIGYSNSQLSYLPSNNVLQNPVACLNFPFCDNYEGGLAFAWYGHRAPLTYGVDAQFYNGHVELLDFGWYLIGHATAITAMAACQGKLFATTANSKLWWRKPVPYDIPWNDMGHATIVVGLAAMDGMLFCATSDGKLWRRSVYGFDLAWQHIGHAIDVTAMTAVNNKLFVTTKENQLWQRDPVGEDIPWELLGHAIGVVGMAAVNGKLIAATSDDNLHWRDPLGVDNPWHRFGRAEHVVGMAAIDNLLFVATSEGGLWQRNL
jgi:hypothetical protein